MLTVCHLAEKAQNINRNTENHDHKRGITSTKLALKERSPTVASVASTTSSHTLLWACIFAKKIVLSWGRGQHLKLEPRPPIALFFLLEITGSKVAYGCRLYLQRMLRLEIFPLMLVLCW